jgi:hypothetical protein
MSAFKKPTRALSADEQLAEAARKVDELRTNVAHAASVEAAQKSRPWGGQGLAGRAKRKLASSFDQEGGYYSPQRLAKRAIKRRDYMDRQYVHRF